uniref:Ig-like domain-containing protein n=1 Tax=Cyprinus carpio carpio TaxID=630221 RepID=A0A8C1D3U6_CYPCA
VSWASMAETVYQFPPSVKVRSGERVTMHCQLNEVQSFCHTVAWVRVHPVSGMIDILQDSNIPRQTKEQVETTVCQASIYNATVQDSGTYYCITTDREHMYLGNVSELLPNMMVLKVCVDKKAHCTVGEFASSRVYVHWLIGSRKENGQTLFVWEEGEENSVKIHNYVAVSAEEWRTEGAYTCVVSFGGWMFNKTLISECLNIL